MSEIPSKKDIDMSKIALAGAQEHAQAEDAA